MLRVSKRIYRRRKEEIEKDGFQNGTLTGNSKDDDDDDDENARLLESIFTAEANPRKRAHRRRRRQHRDATNTNRNPQDEEERLKRFEAACQAMIFNLAGPAPLAIPIPTKRWTRTLDPDAHLEQEYEDLKWGIRKKPAGGGGGTMMGLGVGGVGTSMRHLMMPLDRGASWMMHLPTKVVGTSSAPFSTRASPYPPFALQQQISNISDPLSIYSNPSTLVMRAPGRQKFNQLVALVQQQMIQRGTAGSNPKPLPRPVNAPKMRLMYLTTTAASDDRHKKNLQNRKESNHKYDREEEKLSETDDEKDEQSENNNTSLPTPRRRPAHPISDQFCGENEEYEHNDMVCSNPPRRKVHPMADRFLGGNEEEDEYKDNNMALRNPPRRKAHPMSDRFLGEDDEEQYENSDTALRNPPRRKAHPMSDRFHGDLTTRGYDPTPKRMVGKLATSPSVPPHEPSPVGSSSNESDFFAQVRYGVESQHPPAESDFPPQVRQGGYNYSNRISSVEAEQNLASVEPSVFDQVRQREHNKRNLSIESDFFAKVREMNPNETILPTEDVGLIGSEKRSSQGRDERYSQGEESTRAARHSSSTYSNASQLNTPGYGFESDNNDATHTRKFLPKLQQESPSSHVQQESPKSETSALSGLWNRGRSNLGQVVSSALNAIPEQTAKHLPRMSATSTKPSTPTRSSSPVNLKTRASNVSDKVGGFFNMLRGENGKETEGEHVDDDDGDSHVALGAFRKSQEARRESRESLGQHHDDSSSASSFRVLPAGIRSVIQSISGGASETKPPDQPSPHRSIATRSSVGTRSSFGDMSPDRLKQFHDKVVKNSPLLGDRDREQPIIDTDYTESDASEDHMAGKDFHSVLSSLMMSPDLLTKRLQQAIRAIEERNWDQVSYLIMANPWLAEMPETTTKQYLLHKLAFYGTDDAPADLNQTLLKMFPAAVHKFDRDGNVPLHLAAAAENLEMIELLGEAFSSGASIRNEDGMLPLHFTIASHSGYDPAHDNADEDDLPSPIQVIKTVLKLFPKAVAIPDNDGNLPLHVAVSSLDGPVGVDVVYLLLDEADRQLQDPYGARFYNRVKMEDLENDTVSTVSTEHETDDSSSAIGAGGVVHCNMVRNEKGETPLLTAIRTKNGWEMIEAVACGMGGKKAALTPDMAGNNALHVLVSEEYYFDAAATLSILKVAPEAASMRNGRGVLPIEVSFLIIERRWRCARTTDWDANTVLCKTFFW
jgi:ankyrin repeat protein